ncbi:hypothetical protein EON83_22790 [bacterium]|nr:MAG: hypothetical protein EON83_22790 [bacterium]
MMKRLWLGAVCAALGAGGCSGTGQSSTAQLAGSPSRIIQVFNDGQKIVVNGQNDGKSQLSLVMGSLQWTAKSERPDEFTASLEPSSKVPLGKGVTGEGFIFNVGDSRFNISGKPVPEGELVLRRNSQIVQQGNDYVVADLMPKKGKPIPVLVRLQEKTPAKPSA